MAAALELFVLRGCGAPYLLQVGPANCNWVKYSLEMYNHWPRLGAIGMRMGMARSLLPSSSPTFSRPEAPLSWLHPNILHPPNTRRSNNRSCGSRTF